MGILSIKGRVVGWHALFLHFIHLPFSVSSLLRQVYKARRVKVIIHLPVLSYLPSDVLNLKNCRLRFRFYLQYCFPLVHAKDKPRYSQVFWRLLPYLKISSHSCQLFICPNIIFVSVLSTST